MEKVEKLRRDERIEQLEVDRVVALSLEKGRFHSLLDVGTGSGLFAEAFQRSGLVVSGMDPDADMVNAAGRLVSYRCLAAGAAESLPFADDAFDITFFGMVLHETGDPARALAEARRVARRRVAVLEWPPTRPGDPPPPAPRFSPSEMAAMASDCGYPACTAIPLREMILYLLDL